MTTASVPIYKKNIRLTNIKIYGHGRKSSVSLPLMYEIIRTGRFATPEDLQKKTRNAIKKGIPHWDRGESKDSYKEYRLKSVPAVVPTGHLDRSAPAGAFPHTGVINGDVDPHGDMVVPEDAYEKLKQMPFVEAIWSSFSGLYKPGTAYSVNFRCEFPSPNDIDAAAAELIGLDRYYENATHAVHDAYCQVINHILKEDNGIPVTAGDIKKPRYLVYDPNIWVNPDVHEFKFADMIAMYAKLDFSYGEAVDLTGMDAETWQEFIHESVRRSMDQNPRYEVGYHEGNRWHTIFHYYHHANLLGVSPEDALDFIGDTFGFNDYPRRVIEKRLRQHYRRSTKFHGAWQYRLIEARSEKVEQTVIIKQGEYLNPTYLSPEDMYGKLIHGDTGIGKTHYVCNHLPGKVILAVPLVAIADKVHNKYGFARAGLVNPDKPDAKIVAVFKSLRRLLSKLGDRAKEYTIVVDESHTLGTNTARSFMYHEWKTIWHNLDKFKEFIWLSGSPTISFGREMPKIRVQKAEPKPKTYRMVKAEGGVTKATAEMAMKYADQGYIVLVYLNKKDRERNQFLGLCDHRDDIFFLDSNEKGNDHWEYMLEHGKYPEGKKILLTTGVIREGIDFAYDGKAAVLLSSPLGPEEIQQLSERFRDAERVDIIDIYGPQKQIDTTVRMPNLYARGAYYEKQALEAAHKLNANTSPEKRAQVFAALTHDFVTTDNKLGNSYVPCYVSINHQLFMTRRWACIRNPINMKNALQGDYGIRILKDKAYTAELPTQDERDSIEQVSEARADEKAQNWRSTTFAIHKKTKSSILDAARAFASERKYRLKYGADLSVEAISKVYQIMQRNHTTFNALFPDAKSRSASNIYNTFRHLYLKDAARRLPTDDPARQAITDLETMFRPGTTVPTSDIIKAVQDFIEKHREYGLNRPVVTISQARKLIRPFYKLKKVRNQEQYQIEKFEIAVSIDYLYDSIT